jgi:hypothetical protein
MSTPETQKSCNQGDRVHPTKVRETLREKRREGGRERASERGREVMCHRYMSLSIYQDEPSILPILPTVITTWYDDLEELDPPSTCLEVEHLRFYTKILHKVNV